jgi:hypothetical protein
VHWQEWRSPADRQQAWPLAPLWQHPPAVADGSCVAAPWQQLLACFPALACAAQEQLAQTVDGVTAAIAMAIAVMCTIANRRQAGCIAVVSGQRNGYLK